MTWLVPLPVAIPLVCAGLALTMARRPRLQAAISVTAVSAMLAVAIALLVQANSGPLVMNVGDWAAPVGIALVVDRLSALMLTVSSVVLLGVLAYSIAQGANDETDSDKTPVSVFHPTYLVLAAGVANAFISGDLFNLYVAFEILLGASFVLITLGATGDRIRSGTIYVIVSLLSSVLFLVAIAMIYSATGTLNLAQLGQRLPELDPGTQLILQVMLLLGFGIKAAIFPLSAWLPDSYPTAPAPVTAVFAGLLTKVGIYAIIRTQVLLFPSGALNDALLVLALLTMVVGILGAVAQDDLKRLLSFTLVSHIGYMLFGIAVATDVGIAATIFYVVHHITVQTALFLVAGLIEQRGGTTSLDRLGSLVKVAPALAIVFFVPAMNLAGIPPLSGFLGKVGLLQAGVQLGTPLAYAVVAAGLLTSLLTLYAIVKAWNKAFWQPAPAPLPDVRTPRTTFGAATAIVTVSCALTFLAGPLYGYAQNAAHDLTARSPYIDAVLVNGDRGEGRSPEVADETGGAPDDADSAGGADDASGDDGTGGSDAQGTTASDAVGAPSSVAASRDGSAG